MAERARKPPQLVSMLTGCDGTVNGAVLVEHDDAIITVSSDRWVATERSGVEEHTARCVRQPNVITDVYRVNGMS